MRLRKQDKTRLIQIAEDLFGGDEIEFDSDAKISDARDDDGDGGFWVSAWVWVHSEEEKKAQIDGTVPIGTPTKTKKRGTK